MNRLLVILALVFLSLPALAQRRLVVCDVESLQPISQVSVRSSAGVDITDSLGYFSVPDTCKSLVFTHVNYESRLLNLSEVRDTVFLVSKYMSIREVVVFGKGKNDEVAERMNKMLVLDKTDAQLLGANPSGGNLLGLIGHAIGKLLPKSKSAKRKQKAREIIENY
jgi:mannose/fructose/N-acetylgalactosamine-specific phosphotransferase system component IIB